MLPGLDQPNHSAKRDPALLKAIARGRAWFDELTTGRVLSLQALAERDGITRRYIRRLVVSPFEPRAGRSDLAGPAAYRAHRDTADRTRSAFGLDRAAQTARKLSRGTRRYAAGRGPTAADALLRTGLSIPEVGLHQ